MPAVDFDHWEEWEKEDGAVAQAFQEILKANHIG